MISRFRYSQFRSFLLVKRSYCVKSNNPREIKIETPSGAIAAKLWNESGKKTPILAFHGWMDNAGTFDNLCPLLDKDYPVYAIDFPGHGYSYQPPLGTGVYVSDYVVTVHRLLHYLRFKKVTLLGHSMGADIALFYTGTMPEVVEKLIMIDNVGPTITEAAKQPKITAKSLNGLIKAEERNPDETPRYSYEKIIQKIVDGYKDSLNEDAAKILLVRNSIKHEDGKYSFTYSPLLKVRSTLTFTMEQVIPFLKRVNCDFLLIKSPTSPLFMENDIAKEFLNCYKKASKNFVLEMVEGTHHLHIINPNPVAESINNFLHDKPLSAESKAKAESFLSSL